MSPELQEKWSQPKILYSARLSSVRIRTFADVRVLFFWPNLGQLTWSEIKSTPPAVKVQNLDYWTTREVIFVLIKIVFSMYLLSGVIGECHSQSKGAKTGRKMWDPENRGFNTRRRRESSEYAWGRSKSNNCIVLLENKLFILREQKSRGIHQGCCCLMNKNNLMYLNIMKGNV